MLAKTKLPKTRVLIIDDSRLIRIAASRMFGDEFDILLAVDGADGWDIIQRDPDIQVVFTDLVMPEMDGFEVLQAIRTSKNQAISNLPVIVVTGADNPEIAKQKAFSLGATDFITKPFDATDIKTRARSYAHYGQTTKALQEQTTIDVMTGLLNAKGLFRQLEKEISFVSRHKASMTVMAVEIDAFKDVFIRIGRAGSEAIIRKIGQVLLDAVRKEDTVARTGVSNFTVSMPLSEGRNALEMADRICQTVESLRAKLDGRVMKITVSVGVCVVEPESTCNVDMVLDLSQQALFHASQLGRSQLFQMSMLEYQHHLAEEVKETLSIDQLLTQIDEGDATKVIAYLDLVMQRLAPLVELMSIEQKQRFISLRK